MLHTHFKKAFVLLLAVLMLASNAQAASLLDGSYQGYVTYQRTVKKGSISCPGHYSYLSIVLSSVKVRGKVVTGTVNTTLGDKKFRGKVRGKGFSATVNFKGVYYGYRWKLVLGVSNTTATSATGRLENWAAKSARSYCRDIFTGTISHSS